MSERTHADALIDISTPFAAGAPPWPGDTPTSCGWLARREDGSSVNLGIVTTSPHVGTHADAPLHVESAWPASESLPIGAFVGTAVVVSVASLPAGPIELAALQQALSGAGGHDTLSARAVPARLLLHTGATVARGAFPDAWPTLAPEAVAWLLAGGLQLLGTDAPSVDARTSTDLPVHHALFAGGAYVLENLSLDAVVPGAYELLAPPLLLAGADAAPVRAVLRRLAPAL